MARFEMEFRVVVLGESLRLDRACHGRDQRALELEPGHGVCIADTGSPGHWSVWGVPAQLLAFVTGVQAVG